MPYPSYNILFQSYIHFVYIPEDAADEHLIILLEELAQAGLLHVAEADPRPVRRGLITHAIEQDEAPLARAELDAAVLPRHGRVQAQHLVTFKQENENKDSEHNHNTRAKRPEKQAKAHTGPQRRYVSLDIDESF